MRGGVVFYSGPSLLTGDPIVGVVTSIDRPSKNAKTGDMAQAFVLRSDISPIEAVKTGRDDAICGDCRHRSGSNIGRSCYVVWWLSPNQVFKALPSYERMTPAALARVLDGKHIRLTAYGDAAAVPADAWLSLVKYTAGWTGYTHHWRTCDQRLQTILMASVDSEADMREALALGWRTFRVRGQDLAANEVICPASNEAEHSTTCLDCQLCRGTTRQAKSVAIMPHGNRVRWFKDAAAAH